MKMVGQQPRQACADRSKDPHQREQDWLQKYSFSVLSSFVLQEGCVIFYDQINYLIIGHFHNQQLFYFEHAFRMLCFLKRRRFRVNRNLTERFSLPFRVNVASGKRMILFKLCLFSESIVQCKIQFLFFLLSVSIFTWSVIYLIS